MNKQSILGIVASIVLALLAPVLLPSCQREGYIDENEVVLQFSADTVAFDTVFTAMATTTRQVRVYNRSGRDVLLGSVTLEGGRESRFRLNVDGDTSFVARNIEIMAGDSIFIFIQACINPNDQTTPFVVEDAIRFSNGQRLPVTAWGRNAVYHTVPEGAWFSTIDCAAWDNSLPHVIVGPALVPEGQTLTLSAGNTLYFATEGMLIVDSAATLVVQGTEEHPVLFTSLRHDIWYDSLPGQWQTIWFYNCSSGNIDHAIVENGIGGLRGYPGAVLTVTNTVIRNMSDCGIIGQGATITGDNLLLYDCLADVTVLCGGNYSFSRCTFANYWTYDIRKIESVVLSNCMRAADGSVVGGDLVRADFTDCIVYGTYSTGEVLLSQLEGYAFSYGFNHSIVRGGEWDEDPLFVDPYHDDYHLQEESPAAGIGYLFPQATP